MKSTVLVAVGLSAVLLGTAACGPSSSKDSGASASAGPSSGAASSAATESSDVKAVLTAAVAKSAGTTADYALTTQIGGADTLTAKGQADPAAKATRTTGTETISGQHISIQLTLLNTDLYLKLGVPIPGVDSAKWMHVDATKLPSLQSLGIGDSSDPTNILRFSKAFTSVKQTGPGAFSGTYDATQTAMGAQATTLLGKLGDSAKSLPFEATVDQNGYLTTLVTHLPAIGSTVAASVTTVTLSDFGTAATITAPPASQVQEAPAVFYTAIGS